MEQILATIYEVAYQVRSELVAKYGEPLYGKCIEASETIKERLAILGIPVNDPQGWCIYDFPEYCTDLPYDPHVWCEYYYGNNQILHIDVTADQFQPLLEGVIEPIIIGKKPYYLCYNEPVYLAEQDG
jgi:hypothetical protein